LCRDDRIFVLEQFSQARFCGTRSRCHERPGFASLLFGWDVFDERHQALPQGAGQEVVQILDGPGAQSGRAVIDGPPRDGHVLPGIEELEQAIDAVERAPQLLLERPGQQ